MTDLLTNTLLILSLFIAVTTLARAMNPKAPSINLEDSAKYRFASGSFALTEEFRIALEEEAMPMIRRTIRCYGSDSIELVGHTDGTPAGGVSNLDNVLSHGISSAGLKRLVPIQGAGRPPRQSIPDRLMLRGQGIGGVS